MQAADVLIWINAAMRPAHVLALASASTKQDRSVAAELPRRVARMCLRPRSGAALSSSPGYFEAHQSAVHPLFFAVVLVTMLQAGQPQGTATGFFYARGGDVFLVTSRHVVAEAPNGVRPDHLRLRLHTDAKRDPTLNVERDIPLYVAGRRKWHEHPTNSSGAVDVIVIELDAQLAPLLQQLKPLSRDSFFPRNRLVVPPGEDVMIMGYPLGASDLINNLPIVRHASVATAYGVNFDGEPAFFVDGNLHRGMSGSPVLTKPKLTWPAAEGGVMLLADAPIYLLGVYSGYVENLGMGKVWYADTIEEIISGIKR